MNVLFKMLDIKIKLIETLTSFVGEEHQTLYIQIKVQCKTVKKKVYSCKVIKKLAP